MLVTPLQKVLVRRSFGKLATRSEMLSRLFYQRLFELNPTLRDLFKQDMDEQGRKLMRMLAMCVNYLGQEETFNATVESMGARHVGYGTHDADYKTVGEALLWAMAETLTADFTPDTRDAWVAVYNAIMEGALRGAHEKEAQT